MGGERPPSAALSAAPAAMPTFAAPMPYLSIGRAQHEWGESSSGGRRQASASSVSPSLSLSGRGGLRRTDSEQRQSFSETLLRFLPAFCKGQQRGDASTIRQRRGSSVDASDEEGEEEVHVEGNASFDVPDEEEREAALCPSACRRIEAVSEGLLAHASAKWPILSVYQNALGASPPQKAAPHQHRRRVQRTVTAALFVAALLIFFLLLRAVSMTNGGGDAEMGFAAPMLALDGDDPANFLHQYYASKKRRGGAVVSNSNASAVAAAGTSNSNIDVISKSMQHSMHVDALLVEAREGCGSAAAVDSALRAARLRHVGSDGNNLLNHKSSSEETEALLGELIHASGPLLQWVWRVRTVASVGNRPFGGHIVLLPQTRADWSECRAILDALSEIAEAPERLARRRLAIRDKHKNAGAGVNSLNGTKPAEGGQNGLLAGARHRIDAARRAAAGKRSAHGRGSGNDDDDLLTASDTDIDAVDLRTYLFPHALLGRLELPPFAKATSTAAMLPIEARHEPSFALYYTALWYMDGVTESHRRRLARARVAEHRRRVVSARSGESKEDDAIAAFREELPTSDASPSSDGDMGGEGVEDASIAYKFRRVALVRPHDVEWRGDPMRHVPLHRRAVFAARRGLRPSPSETLFGVAGPLLGTASHFTSGGASSSEGGGAGVFAGFAGALWGAVGLSGSENPPSIGAEEVVHGRDFLSPFVAGTARGTVSDSFVAGSFPAVRLLLRHVVKAHEAMAAAPSLALQRAYSHRAGGKGNVVATAVAAPLPVLTSSMLLSGQVPTVYADSTSGQLLSAAPAGWSEGGGAGLLGALWHSAPQPRLPFASTAAAHFAKYVLPLEPFGLFGHARCGYVHHMPTYAPRGPNTNASHRVAPLDAIAIGWQAAGDSGINEVKAHARGARGDLVDLSSLSESSSPPLLIVGTSSCSAGAFEVLQPEVAAESEASSPSKALRLVPRPGKKDPHAAVDLAVPTNNFCRASAASSSASALAAAGLFGGVGAGPHAAALGPQRYTPFETISPAIGRQLQLRSVFDPPLLRALETAVASNVFGRAKRRQSAALLAGSSTMGAQEISEEGGGGGGEAHRAAAACQHYWPNHDCTIDLYPMMTPGERRMRLRRDRRRLAAIAAVLGKGRGAGVEGGGESDTENNQFHNRFQRRRDAEDDDAEVQTAIQRLNYGGSAAEATRALCPDGTMAVTANAIGLVTRAAGTRLLRRLLRSFIAHAPPVCSTLILFVDSAAGDAMADALEESGLYGAVEWGEGEDAAGAAKGRSAAARRERARCVGSLEVEVVSDFSGEIAAREAFARAEAERQKMEREKQAGKDGEADDAAAYPLAAQRAGRDAVSPYTPSRLLSVMDRTVRAARGMVGGGSSAGAAPYTYSELFPAMAVDVPADASPHSPLEAPPPQQRGNGKAAAVANSSSSSPHHAAMRFVSAHASDLFDEVMMRWLRTNNDRFTYVMSDVDPTRFVLAADPVARLAADVRAYGLARDPHAVGRFDAVHQKDNFVLAEIGERAVAAEERAAAEEAARRAREDEEWFGAAIALKQKEGDNNKKNQDGRNHEKVAPIVGVFDDLVEGAVDQSATAVSSSAPTPQPTAESEEARERRLRPAPADAALLRRLGPHAFYPRNFVAVVGGPLSMGSSVFSDHHTGQAAGGDGEHVKEDRGRRQSAVSAARQRLHRAAASFSADGEVFARLTSKGSYTSGNPFASTVDGASAAAMLVGTPLALAHYYRLSVAMLLAYDRDVPYAAAAGRPHGGNGAPERFGLGVSPRPFSETDGEAAGGDFSSSLLGSRISSASYRQALLLHGAAQLAGYPHTVLATRSGHSAFEIILGEGGASPQLFDASVRDRLRWAPARSDSGDAERAPDEHSLVLRDCRGRRIAGILIPP